MASTRDVMAYFCEKYPYKNELSKARLTKMIYLADWRMALQKREQITPLEWTFNHYGPYLDEVPAIAQSDPEFSLTETTNLYGSPKQLIEFHGDLRRADVRPSERAAMDHVIKETKSLNYQGFINLVYSTFPIVSQPRYTKLDLVDLAGEYQRLNS